MEDKEFQQEVERLIDAEQRMARSKELYILESLKREKDELMAAFHDHIVALESYPDIQTVDELLASINDRAANQDTFTWEDDATEYNMRDHLNELISKEVERFPELLDGEMHISGEGVYVYPSDNVDDNDVELQVIEEGMTLAGEISWYAVESMPSYEAFRYSQAPDDFVEPTLPETLGIWVALREVIVKDGAGNVIEKHEEVLVPINYPSISLHKVIRQHDAIEARPEEDAPYIDIWAQFKNDFILETCTLFENDLNYNTYTPEERLVLRQQYQDEAAIYMNGVDTETELLLSASEAWMPNGDKTSVNNVSAYYRLPVFMQCNDTWRLYHVFEMWQGDGVTFAHILPEHLETVRPIHE